MGEIKPVIELRKITKQSKPSLYLLAYMVHAHVHICMKVSYQYHTYATVPCTLVSFQNDNDEFKWHQHFHVKTRSVVIEISMMQWLIGVPTVFQ